jgi:hypothetical protein
MLHHQDVTPADNCPNCPKPRQRKPRGKTASTIEQMQGIGLREINSANYSMPSCYPEEMAYACSPGSDPSY